MMKLRMTVCLFLSLPAVSAQTAGTPDSLKQTPSKTTFDFSGQASAWTQYTPDLQTRLWLGGRYIPRIEYAVSLQNERLVDFEVSANLYGETGTPDAPSVGKIKPYRAWARYSGTNFEVRMGLQKLNFGSAMMLRPLMWFDALDPRDPLQMTDGVYAGLFKYYFRNNANLWFWALGMNKNVKGWEFLTTGGGSLRPEIGGRMQMPVTGGEVALSANLRQVTGEGIALTDMCVPTDHTYETKLGFDAKLNLDAGLWLESAWIHYNKDLAMYYLPTFSSAVPGETNLVSNMTNSLMTTLGADYTFGVGNGITLAVEHLLYTSGKQLDFRKPVNFSALNLSYPFTLIDQLSAMFYYSWTDRQAYHLLNWKKQFNNFTFHLIGYWNPSAMNVPMPTANSSRFQGKGLQLMVVWNY